MSTNWDLSHILHPTEFTALSEGFSADLQQFSKDIKLTLDPKISAEHFKSLVMQIERLAEALNRLYGYPMLSESTNQEDNQAKFFKSQAKNLISEFDDHTRPFFHWVKGKSVDGFETLDEQNAQRLFKELSTLEYHYQTIRQLAKRTLSEKEEEIITKMSLNGLSVLNDLRSMVETDQRYLYTDPVKNEEVTFDTTAELLKQVYSDNAQVRENTYQALFKSYSANQQKYFAVYEAIVKNWADEVKWRGYDSAISVRNEANDIPDAAVENLIKSCQDNQYIFNEFFELKAKLMGIPKLRRYDLYAPLHLAEDNKFEFAQAKDFVLGLFKDFDADFYAHAKSIFDEKHIDSHPGKTKRPGAFCATITPSIKPYVLLNYADRQRDVQVMAHELGHAIHSCFAENLPVSVQEAPLTLAETASTFAEMLVFEKLYSEEQDPKKKQQMLLDKISESYATINRQIYFILFEKEAHAALPKGIQIEDFNKMYLANLHSQFGDSLEIDPNFQHEWSYIAHIVNSPFYCYSYAFGELLSFALYKRYKDEGQPFIKSIKEILAAGGSENPTALLKRYGFDITQESFWNAGFALIKGWVDELVQLS